MTMHQEVAVAIFQEEIISTRPEETVIIHHHVIPQVIVVIIHLETKIIETDLLEIIQTSLMEICQETDHPLHTQLHPQLGYP